MNSTTSNLSFEPRMRPPAFRRISKSLATLCILAPLFGSALAGEGEIRPIKTDWPIPCPKEINLTLNATIPNVVNADFTPAHLSNYQGQLNYPGNNKYYLHTFQWTNPAECCQCSSAVLTVNMQSNDKGATPHTNISADAGNDTIYVMINAAPVQGGWVYPSTPFGVGTLATKTFTLTGADLIKMCRNHRLSFLVQDDTMVKSATLRVTGCCVTP